MFHALMATTLKHIAKAIEIALDVGGGILDGLTNTSLGREVDHRLSLIHI